MEKKFELSEKLIIYDVRSDLTQKLNIAPLEQRSRRWLIGKDITSEGGSHDSEGGSHD